MGQSGKKKGWKIADPRNWSKCKSCGEPITWARTDSGKAMAINGHKYSRKWSKDLGSHWETCPNANRHRRNQRDNWSPPVEPREKSYTDHEYLGYIIRMIPLLSQGKFLVRTWCPGLPQWEWLGAEYDDGMEWARAIAERNPWPNEIKEEIPQND